MNLKMRKVMILTKLYKGEISKSGASILPSKRVRRVPEKFNIDDPAT